MIRRLLARCRPGLVVLLAWMNIAAAPRAAQQTPPRDTRQAVTPAAGTGALGGIVTNDDGSRPVRFAYVVLIGGGTGTVKVSSTDADGKFIFGNLPADRFTVGVSKPPYLGTVAGAKRPARPGTPIALADGQKITNVAIRMAMGAAITGVITDERGQPGTNIPVTLLQWRMQGGERALGTAPGGSNVTTDDRGRYRFFGLPPGEYAVAAMRMGAPQSARALTAAQVDAAIRIGAAPPPPPAQPSVRYAPVYFPGTTRASEAQSITVAIGEERVNADFRIEAVPTSRVEGSVATSDGQPLNRAQLMITSPAGSLLSTASAITVGPDGRFAVAGLPPGTHVFMVNGNGPQAGQYARTGVEVIGGDIVGVQLTLRPAMTFSGRLAFEGATPAPSVSGRRIPLRTLTPGPAAVPPQVTSTDQTGAFNVTDVAPGRYLLGGPLPFGPTSGTMTWSLQSVIVDGRDVTDLPIEITDVAPKDVAVTYGDRFQELSGRLQSQSGAAVSDYTMVVFPEDKAYWIPGSRRIVTTRPGTDGRFFLSGAGPMTLPPGRYMLAAVTDIDRDEQFNPAFLAALVPGAVPITLAPGEKKVQDLAIK